MQNKVSNQRGIIKKIGEIGNDCYYKNGNMNMHFRIMFLLAS